MWDDAPDQGIPAASLKGMPAFSLPQTELMRSSRGQVLNGVLADPEQLSKASLVQKVAAERALLSVRERSSFQLRDCFASDTPPPRTSETGQPTTRSAMLAMRREEMVAANAAIGANPRLTLPIGVQPGAPGKSPDAKRFTHHDVERLQKVAGR